MLAIFDIDGTICDTQEVEGVCYARAIEQVTGRSLSTLDWTAYDEPTSSAIARDLLAGDSAAERKEEEIKAEFVRLMEVERPKFPGDFHFQQGKIERAVNSRTALILRWWYPHTQSKVRAKKHSIP